MSHGGQRRAGLQAGQHSTRECECAKPAPFLDEDETRCVKCGYTVDGAPRAVISTDAALGQRISEILSW